MSWLVCVLRNQRSWGALSLWRTFPSREYYDHPYNVDKALRVKLLMNPPPAKLCLRIPTENRLLWVDFVEIIWVTILSKQAADQARASEESTAASEVHSETDTAL